MPFSLCLVHKNIMSVKLGIVKARCSKEFGSCLLVRFSFLKVTHLYFCLQPKIDKDSLDILSTECPRVIVNPKPSPFGFRGFEVPREAFPDITLDDPFVKDIDPSTWAVPRFAAMVISPSLLSPNELSMAEKFRLAFAERDTRLAPKRAKNARQRQRRAEREWMETSTSAKAIALASKATKSINGRK